MKLIMIYMSNILNCNPCPIYVDNEISLRAYFGFGGPHKRLVIHVEVERDDDIKIHAIIDDFVGIEHINTNNNAINDISSHDELFGCNKLEACDEFSYQNEIQCRDECLNRVFIIDKHNNNEIVEDIDDNISSGCLKEHFEEQVVDGDRYLSFDGDGAFSFTYDSRLSIGQELARKGYVKKELFNIAIKASFEFHVKKTNKTIYVV